MGVPRLACAARPGPITFPRSENPTCKSEKRMKNPIPLIALVAAFAFLPSPSEAQADSEGSLSQATGGLALGALSGVSVAVLAVTGTDIDSGWVFLGSAAAFGGLGAAIGATSDGRVSQAGKGAAIGFLAGAVIWELFVPEKDYGPHFIEGGLFLAGLGALVGFALSSSDSSSPIPSEAMLNFSLPF